MKDRGELLARRVARSAAAAAVLASTLLLGCGSDHRAPVGSLEGPWVAEQDTIADTIIVRTLSGSQWGRATLGEELRLGRVEGEDHETFGQIGGLAVTPEGDILVYDAQVMVLRRFDAEGRYRGTIGGRGSGPGEYQNVAGLGVLTDGRIVVNDFGNGRFNLYSPAGEHLDTWGVRPAIAVRRPLHPDAGGGVFLHTIRVSGGAPTREEILVRLDGEGLPGDTLVIPFAGYQPAGLQVQIEQMSVGQTVPFSPSRSWSVTSDGTLLSIVPGRYAVDLYAGLGPIVRITRAAAPVPVTSEERAAEEERIHGFFNRMVDGWRWDGPPIPNTKPPVSWVHAGRDGTIWVRVARSGTVIPEEERTEGARSFVREPIVFDVFDSEGRFLGQVHPPPEFRVDPYPVLDHDQILGVVVDDAGVEFVVRFRIEWG